MLDLRIPITIATVEAIKAYLLRALPNVKSSHRVEAVARGLGFRTYAALLQSANSGSKISGPADGGAFTLYLSEHGFCVEAIHLYRAAARIAVFEVMEKVPRLSMRGYGFGHPQWNLEAKRWNTAQEDYASFTEARAEFLTKGGLDQFLLALALVRRVPRTKTVRSDVRSYRLKHIAENMPFSCHDRVKLGPRYVSNGALIAAALHAGFKMRTYFDSLGYDAINVSFNMSKRAVDDLDCEMRPKGAIAQSRKYAAEQRHNRWAYA